MKNNICNIKNLFRVKERKKQNGYFQFFNKKSKPSLKDDILTASRFVVIAFNASGYKVDGSIESLKEVDRFFDEQSGLDGILSKDFGRKLFAIGAFVGEVAISHIGGEWVTDDNDPEGEINASVRLKNGIIFYPMQRVMKRFANGSEDSIYPFIYALKNDYCK